MSLLTFWEPALKEGNGGGSTTSIRATTASSSSCRPECDIRPTGTVHSTSSVSGWWRLHLLCRCIVPDAQNHGNWEVHMGEHGMCLPAQIVDLSVRFELGQIVSV